MDLEKYTEIWEKLLVKHGLGKFRRVSTEGTSYMITEYRIDEPDGRKRIERWLVTSKKSITLSDVANFNRFVEKTGYDLGIMLTQSTLTGSVSWFLRTTTPHVRVYDHRIFTRLLSVDAEIATEYGLQIEEYLPGEAKELLERLDACSPGREAWIKYQDLIKTIFCYLFVPPLNPPKPQSRGRDGLEIPDLVFPNHVEFGFWQRMRMEYKGSYIVVEAKNKTNSNKGDVSQLSSYLNEPQLGLFGLLVSRRFSHSAEDERSVIFTRTA